MLLREVSIMGKKGHKIRTVILFCLPAILLGFALLGQRYRYVARLQELQVETEELRAALGERDRAVRADAERMESLQRELAMALSMEEYETETGFVKKGGIYLIDNLSQLWKLNRMILEGAEIESGIPAAEASYRLRRDIQTEDWFSIGTEDTPFCGSFDGDGHHISGCFPFRDGEDVPEALFQTNAQARIENLRVYNHMDQSPQREVAITLGEDRQHMEYMERGLEDFPDCSVRLEVWPGELDAREMIGSLRERWERNREQAGYFVSVSLLADYEEEPDRKACERIAGELTDILAGEEYKSIIDGALAQEEGYLRFLKLERIGEICCCSFEIGGPDSRPGEGYHLILEGEWEGREVPRQHLYLPYTAGVSDNLGENRGYEVEAVDIDFDGRQDLLIHEGYSSGSGGSWGNYRAVVWREDKGRFEYFPSFPEQLTSLEFDRRRVVTYGRMGMNYEEVLVYGVVNGEYICTRKLADELVYRQEEQDYINVLSYYEMSELVETHILTDWEEREWLYPDMDYWQRG